MTTETLKVQGMSCAHCVQAVEGSVGELKGVSDVTVHLEQGTVDVVYDKDVTSHADIVESIDDQGYDVEQ
ncbi:copper chaperone [Salibacterium salarium]|uniref:copper chaperone CopZ n=1 Tax=Salibacterium salarium TaxID=284579 RepID=UPI00277F700B|nr:copper chaperone CopZ [Salibacterium salarium]MDQ0297764.1 copper chaperone [Salibacterium salarium]